MLVTDAWKPQVNGVVYTLQNVISNITDHDIFILHPKINWIITKIMDLKSICINYANNLKSSNSHLTSNLNIIDLFHIIKHLYRMKYKFCN